MSLGAGFRCLTSSVAVGDDAPGKSNNLTRYYAESGTPPSVFLGSGLACLADGQGVEKGSVVTEQHLYRMLGLCAGPVTGEPLGHLRTTGRRLLREVEVDIIGCPSRLAQVNSARLGFS
jgi:hypothetical protein